eukprot:NODE_114_length_18474_cov_1.567510.p6 type:complete len:405 gc:universal NODE_114_length_18474_cov_1.567510:12289-13503(+)
MVSLGIAVCSQTGQVLVSRHFYPMSRGRVEGLISSFPKLLESNAQHTYVDTDQVRLCFQPLDKVYLIMITNKRSNILQDINTLNLFAKIVQDTCSCTEQGVTEKAFELIHAFDEVISGGQVESLDLGQIKTILEMDSHEEKIHEMIEKNKELEAKAELKKKAKEMEAMKKAASKSQISSSSNYTPAPVATINVQQPIQNINQPPPSQMGKGMQLGGAKNSSDDFLSTLQQQAAQQIQQQVSTPVSAATPIVSKARNVSVYQKDVHIIIDEKLSAQLPHDGGITSCELKGEVIIKINSESCTQCSINYSTGNSDAGIQFKSHPLIDKKSFSDNIIESRDKSKPFPVNQPLSLIKYRSSITDDKLLPLHLECWPNPNGDGTTDVNLEYELRSDLELENVEISIKIP